MTDPLSNLIGLGARIAFGGMPSTGTTPPMPVRSDDGVNYSLRRPQQEQLGDWLLWRAPAKINLTLKIRGLRPDGYHELDSVVARVSLYDELRFTLRGDGELAVDCPTDCGPVEQNLVSRAAMLLKQAAGTPKGAEIRLAKRIPMGAGLGGGSSDAAATLMALNQLWELDLPGAYLAELGERLGSDVPLFLASPACRMQGRGEIIEPMAIREFFAVLFTPALVCPTPAVYKQYDLLNPSAAASPPQPLPPVPAVQAEPTSPQEQPSSQGFAWDEGQAPASPAQERAEDLVTRNEPAPPVVLPEKAIDFSDRPSRWTFGLSNDLLAAALKVCPRLSHFMQRLTRDTRLPVHLTGSGSALFILADDSESAVHIVQSISPEFRSRCRIVALSNW